MGVTRETKQIDGSAFEVITITGAGDHSVDLTATENLEYLIVGGGGEGGGNQGGGGGGAGALRENLGSPVSITGGTYTVTIGKGGGSGEQDIGEKGGDSIFNSITAEGGGGGGEGGGGADNTDGADGGSGGGGGGRGGNVGGTSTSFGNPGGSSAPGSGTSDDSGGGGGGADLAGEDAGNQIPGDGGAGRQVDIDGNGNYYAGGGAGGTEVGDPAAGGIGGGGDTESSASPDTGGGGGGSNDGSAQGFGASGIVILRIPDVNFFVSGVVTDESDGSALEATVRVFRWDDGGLVKTVTSDPSSGEYKANNLGNTDLLVVMQPPSGIRPLAHGPLKPEEE